jgi:hypothetical protein
MKMILYFFSLVTLLSGMLSCNSMEVTMEILLLLFLVLGMSHVINLKGTVVTVVGGNILDGL